MEKRISVVTGGAQGMGFEIARQLGKLGPVLIGARTVSKVQNAVEELKKEGIEAYGKPCDISSLESVQEFAKAAVEIAPVRYALNVAAISFEQGDVEQILNINVLGTINFRNVFLPILENGVLINFASNSGYFYDPPELFEVQSVWNEPDSPDFLKKCMEFIDEDDTFTAYIFSKRFVMYYTMANATCFAEKGNRIFSISPGAFQTPMLDGQTISPIEEVAEGTAVKRIGTPFEMARAVVNLIDADLGYLTGTDIVIDGGKLAITLANQL